MMSISTKNHYENFIFSVSDAEDDYLQASGWGYYGDESNKTWFKQSEKSNCLNCGRDWGNHSNTDECYDEENKIADTKHKLDPSIRTYSQSQAIDLQKKKDVKLRNFK